MTVEVNTMKKIVVIFIISILVLSGLGAVAININQKNIETNKNSFSEDLKLSVSTRDFETKNEKFIQPILQVNELYLVNPGQPMVPKILKSYELPFGATNVDINVIPNGLSKQTIRTEIIPASAPLPYSEISDFVSTKKKNNEIYTSNELFPNEWFSYNIGIGLNAKGKRVTHLSISLFPMRYAPLSGEITNAESFDIDISYNDPEIDIFPEVAEYDLVIIAPSKFSDDLGPLVEHKNSFGVNTLLKTTEEIYSEYSGVDKPEQIKYFIKNAIEEWGITYVLLVGGLKSILYANPRDDTNHGAEEWYLPVRFANFFWDGDPSYNFTSSEPSYICDLYYADIYKEGGVFDNWDSNGNGEFADWRGNEKDELDLYPDVAVGRLACRNNQEVKDVVNKIIKYEEKPADPSWFKRIISISGDGFLDQEDWNIQWDTNSLPDGEYTIFAQASNPDGETGPVDEIHITLDKTVESQITFNHDDHLKEEFQNYPAPPIAEIVSVSNGNILGNTDYHYVPDDGEAYCNVDMYWWANIDYIDGVLTIRGKAYDPKPYGNLTDVVVRIENEQGETIFTESRYDMETYYEGEWLVGEKLLYGRGGAIAYMPDDFDNNQVFTSNGKWVDQSDVIEEFSKGYGLAYFSGHGSPGWWGDHYPGIPGNRRYGQVAGLVVTQITSYFPYLHFPLFPMEELSNTDKLPVVCVGGCHNSMISVSLIASFLNKYIQNYMFTYGTPVPECWGWYMVKMPNTGAIATMGNTGYGWGSEGDVCTIGTGDGWINTEFFRQYGQEGQHVLGMAYSQSIASYVTHHKTLELDYWRIDSGWDGIDQKTVQQWMLLGDPSLMIGGYQ